MSVLAPRCGQKVSHNDREGHFLKHRELITILECKYFKVVSVRSEPLETPELLSSLSASRNRERAFRN